MYKIFVDCRVFGRKKQAVLFLLTTVIVYFVILNVNPIHRIQLNNGQLFQSSDLYENQYCELLLKSPNETLVRQALNYTQLHPRKAVIPEAYPSYTSNCSRYLTNRGYLLKNSTEAEKRFPVAFTLLAYKHVEQIERLLKAIYRPHNVYCVHLDRKAPSSVYLALHSIVSCLPNVFMASRRIFVTWGQFSVLEPEINCLKELFVHKVKWRYVINLTGQEYPLKTNYQLVRILEAFKGANDIRGSAKELNRERIAGRPRAPHGITPCKGPVHFTASREFIDYVLHNKTATDFLRWCKLTGIPDETYFTSLNNNKHLQIPGSYTGAIENIRRDYFTRHKIWFNKNECGSKRFVRQICIEGVADLHVLTTGDKLFVNKLNYEFEPLAYDCLEHWYFTQVQSEMRGRLEFNTTVYEESTVVKYRYIPNH